MNVTAQLRPGGRVRRIAAAALLNCGRSRPYFWSFWVTLRRDRPLWRAHRATLPLNCASEPHEVLALDPADQVAGQVGQRPLDVEQVRPRATAVGVRGATDSGRSSRLEHRAVGQGDPRLDRVLQLADVPRPVVPQQSLHRVRGDLADRRAVLRADASRGSASPGAGCPRCARATAAGRCGSR